MVETLNSRTALYFSKEQLEIVESLCIVVVGCGGVGSMAAEALVRMNIKHLILIDHDVVATSNRNRQIHATTETIGLTKTLACKKRFLSINPGIQITLVDAFVQPDNIEQLIPTPVDGIIDAIDTVTAKLAIAQYAARHGLAMISSMGMGNRLDPTKVTIGPLNKTSYDPLAKVMRGLYRKHQLHDKINVVYSLEIPIKQKMVISDSVILKQAQPPASVAFVPMAAGLACAYEIVRQCLKRKEML